MKGRKRHLLVDTRGLVLVAWMTTAGVQDRDAAAAVLPLAAEQFPSLRKVWAGAAYQGPRVELLAPAYRRDRGDVEGEGRSGGAEAER